MAQHTLRLRHLVAILLMFSCSLLNATFARAEPVKIGVILPLTGPFERYGSKIQSAISSFTDSSVTFVFEDEGCDPKKAVSAYKKLSSTDGIKLFLGPWCGSPQSAVAPQLKAGNQLALLSASASEAVFTESGGRMFSAQHSIEAESTFLAKKLNELGVKSVVIIFQENAFSRAHEAAFRAHFKGKILETIAYNSGDAAEMRTVALRVKQLNPEALFVPDAFPLMAGLAKNLKNIGLGEKKIYTVYSAESEDVLEMVGPTEMKMIYSYPDIGNEEALHYFPTIAAKIISQAVKQCKDDVECVRKYITTHNSFDSHGVLDGKLTLKTIKDGTFVVYDVK